MRKNISVSNLLNAIVPISRFNRGEAGKIFDEVNIEGVKIVVKNNKPTCVLIKPEKYEEIMETVENYNLYVEAEKRMKETKANDHVNQDDIMKKLGITKKDLADIEVDIE